MKSVVTNTHGLSTTAIVRTDRSVSGVTEPVISVNPGVMIFSVESYINPSNAYEIQFYAEPKEGTAWSLKESGVVIVDSTGFVSDNDILELDIYSDGSFDILIKVDTPNVKNYEIDIDAEYASLSYYGDDNGEETTLGKVVITQFSSKIPEFDTWLPDTLITLPDSIPPELVTISWLLLDANLFNQDISMWDVSNVLDMDRMLEGATSFNQDLSNWCVSNITSKPTDFDLNTPSWTLPKPVWGTCPANA